MRVAAIALIFALFPSQQFPDAPFEVEGRSTVTMSDRTRFHLVVERWPRVHEINALEDLLSAADQTSPEMRAAAGRLPVIGQVLLGEGSAHPVLYANARSIDDEWQFLIIVNRASWSLNRRDASSANVLTLVDMRFDSDGSGGGFAYQEAEITFDPETGLPAATGAWETRARLLALKLQANWR